MLTGKAKEMFEGWYLKLPNAMGLNYGAFDITMNRFYCLPESMQFGVYQDWADSMGVNMCVSERAINPKGAARSYYYDVRGGAMSFNYPTRQEARAAALQKLNEIINKR